MTKKTKPTRYKELQTLSDKADKAANSAREMARLAEAEAADALAIAMRLDSGGPLEGEAEEMAQVAWARVAVTARVAQKAVQDEMQKTTAACAAYRQELIVAGEQEN